MSGSLVGRAERTANQAKVPQTQQRLGLGQLVRRTVKEIGDDHVMAFAGNLTYHTMLALFPFVIVVLSVLFVAGQENLLVDGIQQLEDAGALSADAAATINGQVEALASSSSSALGLGLLLSVLTALWAVSGAMRSVMEAMNVVYEVEESRGFVSRYITSAVLAVGVAAMFVVALGLVVAGPSIAALLGDAGRWAWLILQWPLLIGFVLLGIALTYYFAPNVEQEFRFVTVGSVFATAMWLAFSLLFSLYVDNFGSYNETYGTLAGVIILLLYTFYTSVLVLIGAEVNEVIEDAAPDGKNEGERTAGEGTQA